MFVRTATDIGLLIRDVRRRQNLSQAALARRIGTTQGWVSRIEAGKVTAEVGMVLATLSALGIRLDARAPDVAGRDGLEGMPYRLDDENG